MVYYNEPTYKPTNQTTHSKCVGVPAALFHQPTGDSPTNERIHKYAGLIHNDPRISHRNKQAHASSPTGTCSCSPGDSAETQRAADREERGTVPT